MTKAMPQTLFYCHMNHVMGRLVPPYAKYLKEQCEHQNHHFQPIMKKIIVPPIYHIPKHRGGCDNGHSHILNGSG